MRGARVASTAGTAAAAAWAAAEPLLGRALRTPYSDVRLLGAPLARRHWRLAGLAVHLANGAAFGVIFDRLGGRGWKRAVVAAELESLLLWPGMALADRFHPDRRSGAACGAAVRMSGPRPLIRLSDLPGAPETSQACRPAWPPLLRNGRVFAYEVAVHAIFGAVLGTLLAEDG